jgi:hypothetical protein
MPDFHQRERLDELIERPALGATVNQLHRAAPHP